MRTKKLFLLILALLIILAACGTPTPKSKYRFKITIDDGVTYVCQTYNKCSTRYACVGLYRCRGFGDYIQITNYKVMRIERYSEVVKEE